MKLRLRRPRDLARLLRATARRHPDEVEVYLGYHVEEWSALAEASPADAADILEAIGADTASELIAELDAGEAAEVFGELDDELAAELLRELSVEDAAEVLAEMLPEDAADVLAVVDDQEAVAQLLDLMEDGAAEDIRQLLAHAPDSAGGLMTTDIAMLPVGMSAGEAIERIRQLHEELEDLSYVYVVDDDHRLEGVLSFRDLVFNRPGVGLEEVMVREPVAVLADTDREEVAELIQRYHLFGVPVIDHQRRLLGMVTSDSVLEAVQQEASEDFAVAVGAGSGETTRSPIVRSMRARLPWIAFDLVISSVVVIAVSQFEDILSAFTVLAALMPLVARVGGDAGAQSLAVVIRGLAAGDLAGSSVIRVVRREAAIGVLNGLAIGAASGLFAFVMQRVGGGARPLQISLVMAIATLTNLTVAGVAGSGIPFLLRRLGLDPALGSNLLLTTVTDLIGFAGFLAVATALL